MRPTQNLVSLKLLLSIAIGCATASGFAQHDPIRDAATSLKPTLSAERISSEPDDSVDVGLLSNSLHWSPDGAEVGWMHLVRPPAKAPIKTPQEEIWFLSAVAASDSRLSNQPTLLVSATKITAALSGIDAVPRAKLQDEDDDSNPFLLRDFGWSSDHSAILLIGQQSISWLNLSTGVYKVLVPANEPLTDASLSPDNRYVSFIRNHSLCLVSISGGPVHVVAKSPHPDILEGEVDWPYRHEFRLARAYSWSPDSSKIAYLESDDRAVAKYTLRASDGTLREIVYPKPGGEIPLVHVLVKRINQLSTAPIKIDLGITRNLYLPRITWLPDGRHLAIQRIDRRQHTLELLLADSTLGTTRQLLFENNDYWVNMCEDLIFFQDSKRFLWTSQRDKGFRHLYLYNVEEKQLTQLTRGDWEITRVNAIDEKTGVVYFTSTEKTPLERQLYQVNLDGSSERQITQQPGTHEISFAKDAQHFVDLYSNRSTPPRLSIMTPGAVAPIPPFSLLPESGQSRPYDEGPLPSLQPVEFLNLKMHLGAEEHAFMIKPPDFNSSKRYPVIIYLAGGPGEQIVRDAWGGATGLWLQSMAEKGFLIFALDNQGTAARGHYFEEPIHLRFAAQELVDQRDGVAYLKSLPYVDGTRLGVYGWGYGGFLAVHALLDRPVAFKAGFAGAPIVDWHLYDAVFPERYLDDPVKFADGWDASTALGNRSTFNFKGSLMVAQGTEDEVVHIENTLMLQDQLLDAGKSADVLLLSDRGHQIEDPPTRQVLFSRMTEFFVKNL